MGVRARLSELAQRLSARGKPAALRAGEKSRPTSAALSRSLEDGSAGGREAAKTFHTLCSVVGRILASYGKGTGHVFNLGHGITPEVNPEHAGAFLRAVHELSAQYHE